VTIRLRGINLHPIKSTAIRPVEQAVVGRSGLVGDREWMVIDADGDLVTARERPVMFRVVADTPATGCPADVPLRLSAPLLGLAPLDVVPHDGSVDVRIHGRGPCPARPAGPEADAWIGKALGVDGLRLVWCSEPGARTVTNSLARPSDRAAFHDVSPVSLASDTSMAALNTWMGEDLPVSRFRSNLVVDGTEEAFEEDGWSTVRIGGAILRAAGPIQRCVMTTIDVDTLAKGQDPIKALAVHRRRDGKTWFAIHLMIDREGAIAVGDELTIA
jgi:uncharacterized protein